MTQLGLKTNNEVAEAIAYCTEGNLLASMQEIQKLQIAYPGGVVSSTSELNILLTFVESPLSAASINPKTE